MTFSRNRVAWAVIALLWWLLFWSASWDFQPSMDSMTYGALAKHVLSTGDWATLHYTRQGYADFHQHPPLGIWMAALVFSLFPPGDITIKILPTGLALACVGLVHAWARLDRSRRDPEWTGFVCAFVLLTSTRFVRYSTGLMLDTPLTLFMGLSLYAWLRAAPGRYGLAGALSGLFFAAAFLSKGLPALAVPAVLAALACFAASGQGTGLREPARFAAGFFAAAGLVLGAWLAFGNGAEYLREYLRQSVSGRVGGDSAFGHLAAIRKLLQIYWPWLPFYSWGLVALARRRISWESPAGAAALASLAIVAGFTASGHFLEHYLVPFFPFAAVVVGTVIADRLEPWRDGILKGLLVSSVLGLAVFAALPLPIHRDKEHRPLRFLLRDAVKECRMGEVSQVVLSSELVDVWLGLALGSWYTPWDARVAPGIPPRSRGKLFVARSDWLEGKDRSALPLEDWERSSLARAGIAVFQRSGSGLCP